MDNQKRIIEINHALSGIHGEIMKGTAFKVNETRYLSLTQEGGVEEVGTEKEAGSHHP